MTPTPEQAAIVEAAKSTSDNLIVHALAGAAKTSTLVLIAKALPSTPMMCLAFNVRIKEEMRERLPGNCEAFTLNSIGHRVWSQAIGRRLVVDKDKVYKIVQSIIEDLPGDQKGDAYNEMANIIKAVNQGKTYGYVPTGKFPVAKRLLDDEEFFADLDEAPTEIMERVIRDATIASITQALQGTIDYADQLFMPTLFHGSFPATPLLLVDEAQDLSELNHAMLLKITRRTTAKPGRLIAVGDPNQSIYGFRGAHPSSMATLEQTFAMRSLELTISFRCPRAVVREAHWRTPHMKYPEWAAEGEVRRLDKWSIDDLGTDAVILCRNNAPLFNMAITLLKNGRYPQLVGNDIGKVLIKIMKKLGPAHMKREEAEKALDLWAAEKRRKTRVPASLDDQIECIEIFFEQGDTLGDAIAYAEHILAVSGNIKMMTGHKSKGLEWPNVFLLDIHLVRDNEQERNLKYVMQTRAKERLTYVNTDGFEGV